MTVIHKSHTRVFSTLIILLFVALLNSCENKCDLGLYSIFLEKTNDIHLSECNVFTEQSIIVCLSNIDDPKFD